MTATELRQKRANLVRQCRAIVDKYPDNAQAGTWSAEDRQAYDKIWGEVEDLKKQITALEEDDRRRRQTLDASAELDRPLDTTAALPRPGTGPGYTQQPDRAAPYCFDVRRPGMPVERLTLARNTPAFERHTPEYRQAWSSYLRSGRSSGMLHANPLDVGASLQTDLSTAGGYMVAPEEFVAELLMNVDDIRWIRRLARRFTTNAQTLGAVKRTAKMKSFVWGSELTDASTTKDTTLAYGKRTLTPHYMVGEILLSRDLARSAMLPITDYIRYEIGRDSGELEENGFLTGNGTQQPLGVFTATNDGIGTAQDVNTGNTTTAIGADNLRAMKYSLKYQYREHPSLRWLFHRTAISQISRLKDGEGRYLWQDGITMGDPDRILGIAVAESEFSPSTFTTGQYVGILGAWFYYWIADSLEMDLLVLVEKYAETNQIAYVARRKTDGMPQIAEAFVRSKLA
jgi:HK97 family phage major capsid protein